MRNTCLVASMICLTAVGVSAQGGIRQRPNVLVSRDGDVPHVETVVATNPQKASNIIGAAIVLLPGVDGIEALQCQVYFSLDGGTTWNVSHLPFGQSSAGVDPQVAFGPDGTAYFLLIAPGGVFHLFRSDNGGATWSTATTFGKGDHAMLAVDDTQGAYRGRVYVAAEISTFTTPLEHKGRTSRVLMYVSSDRGKSFAETVVATQAGAGLMAESAFVMNDGTVVVSMRRYPNPLEDELTQDNPTLLSNSTDGGVSFSGTNPGPVVRRGAMKDFYDQFRQGALNATFTTFSAADRSVGPFRNRVYMVWNELRGGRSRIVLSLSSDRGQHWSDPREVYGGTAAGTEQYQAMVHVNRDGVVGITWFGSTPDGKKAGYNVYFTASSDGADSFATPVRVSSRISLPSGRGNLKSFASRVEASPKGMSLYVMSMFSRYRQGGEYTGLTDDARGRFRLLWPDSRSGTFQMWTAEICVQCQCDPIEHGVSRTINDEVSLIFDPADVDPAKDEVVLWVRLRNTSKHRIYAPMSVVVKGVADSTNGRSTVVSPVLFNGVDTRNPASFVPITYSEALGSCGYLDPGDVSEALPWRFTFGDVRVALFPLTLDVIGSAERELAP